jgi:hypothetical protein
MTKGVNMFIAILAFAAFAHADQDVKLVNPDTFCKIETFAAQKGKAPSGNYKKCDSLKDKAEVQVKSMSECKQRALAKGEECLKTSASSDLGVTGKFIEKFSVSFNSTSFTCAVSKGAGNVCP